MSHNQTAQWTSGARLIVCSSNSMMQKKKASLRDKQKKLRASIDKRKKAKR